MQPSRVIRVNQVNLVFGMEWIPLLGDAARASSMARGQGASHQILSGDPVAALGIASGLSRSQKYWSAAALMAHQHSTGTVVWLLALGSDMWHVLACHEGVALARADRSYPDRELACQAIDALRTSYPHLELQDELSSLRGVAEHGGCLQGLAQVAKDGPSLQPVRRVFRIALWAFGLAAIAVLVSAWLWSASPVANAPHQAAWEKVLEDTLARRPIHGVQGTRELLAALYRQPVRLAGWRLQSVRCEWAGGTRPWQCVGEYRRALAGADNRGFMQAAPAQWRLDFPSLDRVRVRWPLTLAVQRPDPHNLPTSRVLAREWVSALQEILPAFSRLQVEPARSLGLVAPRDAEGKEVPPPSNLPTLATRVLRVQGPLQSASLLVPFAQPVSWQKVVLDVAPTARVGLRTGRLILQLEGIVYESA